MDQENFSTTPTPSNESMSGMGNRNADMNNNPMNTAMNNPPRYNGMFQTPPQQNFNTEEMRGSMQNILAQNIGEYVVVEFLIGTTLIMRKQGILYSVGTSVVTLYDDIVRNYIVCDIFSVKFVYFYFPGDRPPVNYNVLDGQAAPLNPNARETRGRGTRR